CSWAGGFGPPPVLGLRQQTSEPRRRDHRCQQYPVHAQVRHEAGQPTHVHLCCGELAITRAPKGIVWADHIAILNPHRLIGHIYSKRIPFRCSSLSLIGDLKTLLNRKTSIPANSGQFRPGSDIQKRDFLWAHWPQKSVVLRYGRRARPVLAPVPSL